ncbi:MAG: sigma-70 family RNA polymerase sigma factor [Rikenellaceae bacterium]
MAIDDHKPTDATECGAVSDQRLVERSCLGDQHAYQELMERYRIPLENMLVGRGVVDIEDIMQESFIKAYLNLGQYNSQYSFGQWICGIARNLHIDRHRKSHSRSSMLQIEEVNTPSESLNPEQTIITRQSSALLERRLSLMPENYRRVLRLRFWEDLSYEEISRKLAIPLGTVKTQIHRGRVMLLEDFLLTSGG